MGMASSSTARSAARPRLVVLTAFAVLAGLVGALAAASPTGAQTELTEPPPELPPLPPGTSDETLEVKLADGASIDDVVAALPPDAAASVAGVSPLFDLPGSRLDEIQAAADARGRAVLRLDEVPDLRTWYRLDVAPGADAARLVTALRALDPVVSADGAPLPAPPPAPTPDFTPLQGYVGPATAGIDAEFSSTRPGGNGAGITVFDVEYSWNQSHEDLSKAAGVTLLVNAGDSAIDPFSSDNHGTAVLGQLVADNDDKGVTGASWGADVGLAPAFTANLGYNPGNAIALATAAGAPGDVILIEQQTTVCGLPTGNYGPSEWRQSVFDATQVAVANGLVVVAAAGNGSVDLDQPGCLGRFDRNVRDSGAIIVGAGGVPAQGDRQRLSFSSWGSRVDVQGWGHPGRHHRLRRPVDRPRRSRQPEQLVHLHVQRHVECVAHRHLGRGQPPRASSRPRPGRPSPHRRSGPSWSRPAASSSATRPRRSDLAPTCGGAIPAATKATVLAAPCVLYDSTAAGGSLAGPLPAGATRTVQVTGALPPTQGVPDEECVPEGAFAVIYTVSAIDAQGPGNLRLSRAGEVADGGVVNYSSNGLDNANTRDRAPRPRRSSRPLRQRPRPPTCAWWPSATTRPAARCATTR